MIFKIIRKVLGMMVVFFDWITKPKAIQRSEEAQLLAQQEVEGLSLYQFYACPFCVKVRRAIHRLNVKVETRDLNTPKYRDELESGGGKIMAPCLRIEENNKVQWLYESSDIIKYLNEKVGLSETPKLSA